MNRVWTWHETALDPVPGAATELREWLAVVFGLAGPSAVDLEVIGSEVVVWAATSMEFAPSDVIEVSADRPPGAVHVEVAFPSSDPVEVPPAFTKEVLDERSSAWGMASRDGNVLVWYEVAIPTAGWELELAEDADLVERLAVDPRAGDELVARYDPLIRRMASRYRRAGVESDDLYQVGREALLGAAHRFDPTAASFERFVSRTVSGTFKKHLRDRGWSLRPPRGLQELVLELRATEAELSQRLGRHPTPEELARAAGRSPDEIHRARKAAEMFDLDSLDLGAEDGFPTLLERVGIEDPSLQRAARWAVVDMAMDALGPREREIVRLRYFEDLSQREIAERVGVSQMHVSRLLRASIAELQRSIGVSEPG